MQHVPLRLARWARAFMHVPRYHTPSCGSRLWAPAESVRVRWHNSAAISRHRDVRRKGRVWCPTCTAPPPDNGRPPPSTARARIRKTSCKTYDARHEGDTRQLTQVLTPNRCKCTCCPGRGRGVLDFTVRGTWLTMECTGVLLWMQHLADDQCRALQPDT